MSDDAGPVAPSLIAAGSPLFSFAIAGQPVPWARARGGTEFGGFYTSPRQRNFKRTIGSYCRIAMLQARVKCIARPFGVALATRVYLEVPKSWRKSKPDEFDRAMRGGFCIEKPDLDNWLKLPMDAMTGIAWEDDEQVVSFPDSGKWFDHARPRLEVDVWAVAR